MNLEPLSFTPHPILRGHGRLGGQLPQSEDLDSPDGRARILNEPARVRIVAFARNTMRVIGMVVSSPDGTWEIPNVNPEIDVVVIGFDDMGSVNAAIQDWVRAFVPES